MARTGSRGRPRQSTARHARSLTAGLAVIALMALPLPAFADDTSAAPSPTSAASSTATASPSASAAASTSGTASPSTGTSRAETAQQQARDAAEPTLSLTLTQTTGTGPFDADDAPGHDSSATNDVVRTNDTVSYTVGVRYEGEDQTHPTISFTLPQGEELVSLPPYCLTGSSVSPTLPAPTLPVTATSWQTLPQQTVTCVVADQAAGTALNYVFVSQVRPEVPNGTTLGPVKATATSDQVTTPAESPTVQHTVSAAAQFDVSKRAMSTSATSGPLYSTTAACSYDPTQACRSLTYPLTISAPADGKGSTALASPIALADDLTPQSFYGAAVWAQAVAQAGSESAAIAAYAPRLVSCGNVTGALGPALPGTKITGASTATNSVRDSGTISCVQAAPGDSVSITINDADTTAYTVPSQTLFNGAPLPASAAYVVSRELKIEVPVKAIMDLGVQTNGSATISTHNAFTDISMTDIAGHPNTAENPDNNVRDASLTVEQSGSMTKFFSGLWGAPNNVPAGNFWTISSYQGPPGSGTYRDGNISVLGGQIVQSNLVFGLNGVPGSGTTTAKTYVGCDSWDAADLRMVGDPSWRTTAGASFPSNGDPAYVSRYLVNSTALGGSSAADGTSTVKNFTIEYSSGPTDTTADCSTGTWYQNPDDVPGSVKTTTNGITTWAGINRVRVSFTTDWGTADAFVSLGITINQQVVDTGKRYVGNWASYKATDGVESADAALADPSSKLSLSNYDPTTHLGSLGDRLQVVKAVARISKEVENPTTGAWVSAAVPQYTAGSTVRWRLSPTLTADVQSQGSFAQVYVEDCLPKYEQFESAVREGSGQPISPVKIQAGAPAGSEITCPADQTYVKWDLGQLPVGQAIDPIVVTTSILETARNGVYTNTTMVSSPEDSSVASLRTDSAQLQLVVPTGLKIAKSTPQSIVEVNPAGVTHPRVLTWKVEFANIDNPANIANVDVIDALPADGLRGSTFTGTLAFDAATPAAGTGISILYTKAPAAALSPDPTDPSNSATGATVWCDASAGGTVVSGNGTAADCPASAAEVTGLRAQRAGDFTPDDDFAFTVTMIPSANASGDIYRNVAAGRADGVSQQVGPVGRAITIAASSIGDRVWEDVNHNGIQDAGEPGVPGWPVELVGTDVDGNAVDLTTTTAADGTYAFDGLASGDYHVVFTRDPMPVNTTWTLKDAGGDDTVDSDVAPATGVTGTFSLPMGTADTTHDAGIYVDRNVDITVAKKYVGSTPLTADNETTVTYDVVVTNNGTAQGTYDLADQLKFGQGITVRTVTVANTDPGTVTTNAGFDGVQDTSIVGQQTLAGGASATYRVTVDATVTAASTTTSRDCTLDAGESGTGFLNQAQVSVAGDVVSTDTACGAPGNPRTPDITVKKSFDAATPLDDDNHTTVTYDVVVTNQGDGNGTYDLSDVLHFGAGITIQKVAVANTDPGTIVTDPAYDGAASPGIVTDQPLASGQSETYRVTVDAVVTTASTPSSRDCTLGTSEQGTGFLNQADVSVGGEVVSSDTACGTAPVPRVPELSVTKRLVHASDPDKDHHVRVTYQIEVANHGTLAGTYDLADRLQFAGQIGIDGVHVTSTKPSGLATAPDFDGQGHQTLVTGGLVDAGGTQAYTVTVDATLVPGMDAAARDCTLSGDEKGTGYLNEAVLTTDGATASTSSAKACGTTPPVTPTFTVVPSTGGPGLPNTGGPSGLYLAGGIGACALGLLLVVVGRRRGRR